MFKHKRVSTAPAPENPDDIGADDWNDVHIPLPGLPLLVAATKRRLNIGGPDLAMQNYPVEAYGLFDQASVYQANGDAGGGVSYVEFGFDLKLPVPPVGYEWQCFATGSVYYASSTTPGVASTPTVSFEATPSSAYMIACYVSGTTDDALIDMSVYGCLIEAE